MDCQGERGWGAGPCRCTWLGKLGLMKIPEGGGFDSRRRHMDEPTPPFYCLENARSEEEYQDMQWLEERGVCVLCPDSIEKHTVFRKRIGWWFITENQHPGPDAKLRFLIVPCVHITDAVELSNLVWDRLLDAVQWVVTEYGIENYKMIIRCGDPKITGATIAHVHADLIVPAG